MSNPKTIGGTMIIHNGVRLDYCFEIALRSLAAICDEVVVVEAESEDETRDRLEQIRRDYSQITIISKPWIPSKMGVWLSDLTNEARGLLKSEVHLSLQADEVLDPLSRDKIRAALPKQGYYFNRLNFWMDHKHIVPKNRVCSSIVLRMAPQAWPSYGDAEVLKNLGPSVPIDVPIYHYGFLRNALPFASKCRDMGKAFFDVIDPICDDLEARGKIALIDPKNPTAVTTRELLPFHGQHPEIARPWLIEHGYND